MNELQWFEAMGAMACDRAWEDGEGRDVPVRDFSAGEVRARLAQMATDDEHPLPSWAAVMGDEHVAAFSLGFWREHREREDNRSEAAYERQCAAYYGGDGPKPVEEILRDAARLK